MLNYGKFGGQRSADPERLWKEIQILLADSSPKKYKICKVDLAVSGIGGCNWRPNPHCLTQGLLLLVYSLSSAPFGGQA
jgi:hypothetical protein